MWPPISAMRLGKSRSLMSVAVIINPKYGTGGPDKGRMRAQLAAQVLAEAGEDGDVTVTTCRGHARELSAAAVRRGARLVVASIEEAPLQYGVRGEGCCIDCAHIIGGNVAVSCVALSAGSAGVLVIQALKAVGIVAETDMLVIGEIPIDLAQINIIVKRVDVRGDIWRETREN